MLENQAAGIEAAEKIEDSDRVLVNCAEEIRTLVEKIHKGEAFRDGCEELYEMIDDRMFILRSIDSVGARGLAAKYRCILLAFKNFESLCSELEKLIASYWHDHERIVENGGFAVSEDSLMAF